MTRWRPDPVLVCFSPRLAVYPLSISAPATRLHIIHGGGTRVRKLIVHEFITLDGVIQAPGAPDEDTDGGFAHGGWTLPFWHDDIGARFFKTMADADTLLLGRKTWQTHGAAFDPMPVGDPFGDLMNGARKVVVSTTLKSTTLWRNTTLVSGNVVAEVRKLKQAPGMNILMDGSSVLIHALAEADLVDAWMLHVYPLVLGSGKRLFPAGKRLDLRLVESHSLPTGVVFMQYVPA
jgi:dihydrofolate reductase